MNCFILFEIKSSFFVHGYDFSDLAQSIRQFLKGYCVVKAGIELPVKKLKLLLTYVLINHVNDLSKSIQVKRIIPRELEVVQELIHIDVLLINGDLEAGENSYSRFAWFHLRVVFTFHFMFRKINSSHPNSVLAQESGEISYIDHSLPISHLLVENKNLLFRHVFLNKSHQGYELLLGNGLREFAKNLVQIDIFWVKVHSEVSKDEV